jgi:dihydroneopterin aldolase
VGDKTLVTLRGMVFNGLIGVLPHESEIPQPIEVDLSLRVERAKGEISEKNILDYRHAYDLVAGILAGGHIPYLEEAAERIAAGALAMPLVRSVRVAVRKPKVQLSGPLSFAEVAIERNRG